MVMSAKMARAYRIIAKPGRPGADRDRRRYPCARTGCFLVQFGAQVLVVSIEMDLRLHHIAQPFFPITFAHGLKIAVPPPVLVHGYLLFLFLCKSDQFIAFATVLQNGFSTTMCLPASNAFLA